MEEAEMIALVLAAAEKGYPGDRAAQIRAVAAAGASPGAPIGVFLKALEKLTREAAAD